MLKSLAPSGLGRDLPWRWIASSIFCGDVVDGAAVDGADVSAAPLELLAMWPAEDSDAVSATSLLGGSPSINALILGMVDQGPLWRDGSPVAHCRLGALQQALVSLPSLEGMGLWALTLLDSVLTSLASDAAFVVRVAACQILRVLEARWPTPGTTRLTPESIGHMLGQVSAAQGQLIAAICFHQELLALPEPARSHVHIASSVDGQSFALVCPFADDGLADSLLVIDGEHHTMWWMDARRVRGDLIGSRFVLRAPPMAGASDIVIRTTDDAWVWAILYIPGVFK